MLSTFEEIELLRFIGILPTSVNGSNGRSVSKDLRELLCNIFRVAIAVLFRL